MKYDYLIVGAGLFGSVFANEATKQGKKVLVIDKRKHLGGNVYNEQIEGINVHKYGAHIFHTNDKKIWDYVNQFAEFNRYTNSPLAFYKDKLYNLPFNMNTFYQIWGTKTPGEARQKIQEQIKESGISRPKNLEEQAVFLVGRDIYEILISEKYNSEVYIHGFTASSEEVRPLPDKIANDLNANLFFTRLTGHGRNSKAMELCSISSWMNEDGSSYSFNSFLEISRGRLLTITNYAFDYVTESSVSLILKFNTALPNDLNELSIDFNIVSTMDISFESAPIIAHLISSMIGKDRYHLLSNS